MRIAAVDDSLKDRLGLQEQISRYFNEKSIPIMLDGFDCAEDFLAAFVPGKYQIVFLDIYMNAVNGIEAARCIYQSDPHCRLVFFTTSSAHAVDGYEVQARFYLQKPLNPQKLQQALTLCCKGLQQEGETLDTRADGIALQIPRNQILYLDCVERTPRLHLAEQILSLSEPLGTVLSRLENDRHFYSCNRGILVNLEYVVQLLPQAFLMKNGEQVPIRQKGQISAKKALMEYSLNKLCGEDLE